MTLSQYFKEHKGMGVLSTADADGVVNSAIYASPHFMEDGTVGLIMANRLSHENLESNPHAAYLFVEEGPGYRGRRLKLTKVGEERDDAVVQSLRRRFYPPDAEERMKPISLVYFTIEEERPLVGAP